jgi:hypothetical protein
MAIGENIRLASQLGLLTDTAIQNATTYTDLQAAIRTAAAGLHSDMQGYAERLVDAIEFGKADGTLNDTDIQAATSGDTLAALTQSAAGKIGPILE